jgi:hypothetical protein
MTKSAKISKTDSVGVGKTSVDEIVWQKMSQIITVVGEENLAKLAATTESKDFQKATHRVYDNSAIEVQVLK